MLLSYQLGLCGLISVARTIALRIHKMRDILLRLGPGVELRLPFNEPIATIAGIPGIPLGR